VLEAIQGFYERHNLDPALQERITTPDLL
jgi:hypothetical protein